SNESYTWICWAKKDGVYAKEGDRRGFNTAALPGDSFQPDGRIRRSDEVPYIGNNIHNNNGSGQNRSKSVKRGVPVWYQVLVQNDGTARDKFKLKGTKGTSAWEVRYFAGGTEVTSAVTGSGWVSGWVAAGADLANVGFFVTPQDGAEGGSARTVYLNSYSVTNSTLDTVRGHTACQVEHRADMLVRRKGDPAYLGDGVRNTNGAYQTALQTVKAGARGVYQAKLQNDGNVQEAFVVTASGLSAPWTVAVFDTATGTNVSSQVLGGGWTTPALRPDETRLMQVEVSAPAGAALGAVRTVLITANPSGSASGVDAVKAKTTVGDGASSVRLTSVSAATTSGGAEITFALSGAADVSALVRNVAGRPVRRLVTDRAAVAGVNRLIWNATSDAGLRVPSGVYLVEITARGTDGSSSRALTSVRLDR
ncbi:MAG: hypothetical protein FJX74_26420, partial [Armatimonadetes bacterium]|nr:hypothetical protein [Armatimonadota bacterium]